MVYYFINQFFLSFFTKIDTSWSGSWFSYIRLSLPLVILPILVSFPLVSEQSFDLSNYLSPFVSFFHSSIYLTFMVEILEFVDFLVSHVQSCICLDYCFFLACLLLILPGSFTFLFLSSVFHWFTHHLLSQWCIPDTGSHTDQNNVFFCITGNGFPDILLSNYSLSESWWLSRFSAFFCLSPKKLFLIFNNSNKPSVVTVFLTLLLHTTKSRVNCYSSA